MSYSSGAVAAFLSLAVEVGQHLGKWPGAVPDCDRVLAPLRAIIASSCFGSPRDFGSEPAPPGGSSWTSVVVGLLGATGLALRRTARTSLRWTLPEPQAPLPSREPVVKKEAPEIFDPPAPPVRVPQKTPSRTLTSAPANRLCVPIVDDTAGDVHVPRSRRWRRWLGIWPRDKK